MTYQLYGKLKEDREATILASGPLDEVLVAYRAKCDYMRDHGFRVVASKNLVTKHPFSSVWNPVSGYLEVIYGVEEAA